MTVEMRGAVSVAAREELARRYLIDFGRLVYSGFQAPKHIEYLSDLLERVERGEIPRLAISAPPGHGKSVLLQTFAAWFIGRDPRRRLLTLSASEKLAKRNSRDTQALVNSDEWPWPDISLATDSVLEWSTNRGGEVRAIGKGGVVTGFRAEGIIVDDLQEDAGSDVTRPADYEWFLKILTTRLEPNAWVVVIQTRWHDSDIIGQICDSEAADQWVFVNLPAIALDRDILGRSEGEVLWPGRWPLDKLMAKKAELESVGGFSSLYQGDPVPAGGATFQPAWFEHRYDEVPQRLLTFQAIDSAWKDGLANDRSVIATLATDMRDIYLVDLWAGRAKYADLRRIVIENYQKHWPRVVYVEEAASGYALVDELRSSTHIPIRGVAPGRDSKEARADATTGYFEAGRIKLPKRATWMADLLGEFLRFPHGKHDDVVDAVVLGISQIRSRIESIMRAQRSNRVARAWMQGKHGGFIRS